MHRLAQVKIENFRSCRNVTLSLSDCTPVVGYNNAGKSNLLKALAWFVSPKSLTESDFHYPDRPVSVIGTIEGVDDEILALLGDRHRPRIEPLLENGSLTLRRIQNRPGDSANAIKLQVPEGKDAEGAISAWKDNPNGIPEAFKALFPLSITIDAMKDAAEDAARAKSSSTLGKLLAEFTKEVERVHGNELARPLENLNDLLSVDGAKRVEELKRFDEEATTALRPFFPGIKLHLDIPVSTVSELFGKGTIKISEADRGIRDFTALGHGAQRSIQMALVDYLAELRAEASDSAQRRLLLVEEPELFLHPQAVEKVREALERLSKAGYQVVFATHSPLMVNLERAADTRIVRKDPTTQETVVMASAQEAIDQRIRDENKRLNALFALEHSNDWLFSDRVLIVEGPTERYLMPFVYKAITGRKPVDDGLGIIAVDGEGGLIESLEVFQKLGIEVRGLVDLDFALNGAVRHRWLDKSDEDIKQCLCQLQTMAENDPAITLHENGRPRSNPNNSQGNKKPSEVFREWAASREGKPVARNLHKKLRQYNIWLWTGGDIEHHLGIVGPKSIKSWSPFRRRLEQESVEKVVSDYETVEAMVRWVESSSGPV